jgi:hypothetical protein
LTARPWIAAVGLVAAGSIGCVVPAVQGNRDAVRLHAYAHPVRAWWEDRARDALDVATVGVEGPAVGAELIAGPIGVGLFTSHHPAFTGGRGWIEAAGLDGVGLRGGRFGVYYSEEVVLGVGRTAWLVLPADRAAELRGKAWPHAFPGEQTSFPPAARWRLGGAVALGLGLRAEINVAEIADLALGLFGADLLRDDLGRLGKELERATSLALWSPTLGEDFEAIVELVQLESLKAYGGLATLPPGLGRLSRLVTLELDGNHLGAWPDVVTELASLERLRIASSGITGAVPPTLGRLVRLRHLTLRWNQIDALPEALGALSQLETLDLESNQLSALPASLGALRSLRTLDLSRNRFSELPVEALAGLPALQSVEAEGNPLSCEAVRSARAALGDRLQVGPSLERCLEEPSPASP